MRLKERVLGLGPATLAILVAVGCGTGQAPTGPNSIPNAILAASGEQGSAVSVPAITTAKPVPDKPLVKAVITQQYYEFNHHLCREGLVYLVAYGSKNCRTRYSWKVGPPEAWWPSHQPDPPPAFTKMELEAGLAVLKKIGVTTEGVCQVIEVKIVTGGLFYPWSGKGTISFTVSSRGGKDTHKEDVRGCKG